jgi:methanogenic corrinoid protein MtbC1
MENIIERLSECVESGKVDRKSPYPPHLKDQDGAFELTSQALEQGISPEVILSQALIPAMERIGQKFAEKKVFVPQMLISAKAMSAAMSHLKPYFQTGNIKTRGTFVIGTVQGDLHDIGKNLVAMMIEGGGWTVVDLGVDVTADRFLQALIDNPGAAVGLSALLTTTMVNMKEIVAKIKAYNKNTKVLVGGAPVNNEFCQSVGADFYSPDPQGAVEYLKQLAA